MRAPSVLHIADKFGVDGSTVCGVTRLFSSWIPRFRAAGVETNVVCLKSRGTVDEEFDRANIDVTYLGKRKGDPSTLFSILQQIKESKPDILHLHGYGAGIFGRVAALITGLPVVLHEHFVDPSFPIYEGPIEALLAPAAVLTLAVSKSVADFCVEKRHIPRERVQVVYNGAAMDEFARTTPAETVALRRELQLPLTAPIVGAIGRLHEQKGFGYLIEAAPGILAACPNAYVVVVGDGAIRGELEARISHLGLEDRVRLVGYRRDISTCLSMFDVVAMPSLWEGLPLTALEAMAQGKAMVMTPVDGLGEVFEDGYTALFVPPRDANALGSRISALLLDPALRRRIGTNCAGMAPSFDIAAGVSKMITAYEAILAQRRK